MPKTEVVRAMVEPNIKATIAALADIGETNESAILRQAARRYIEAEIADLEQRIVAATLAGRTDTNAARRLAELRAAYEEQ
jgi:hypothetical protein